MQDGPQCNGELKTVSGIMMRESQLRKSGAQ